MKILGSERTVTQNYAKHKHAEDYAGAHLSDIKIYGKAKVTRVVNKYKVHEDTINHNDFVANKAKWKDGNYYNCISITGKVVRYHQSETAGNQVELECYIDNQKYHYKICHMAEVYVSVGDIIDSNTLIGRQGNTGTVLSSKPKTDVSYGSHVHFEVTDQNYTNINPRSYAIGNIQCNYLEQTNVLDSTKDQIKIKADKINIRSLGTVLSSDIGDVYNGEIYDVIGISEDEKYTWYHIKTSLGTDGFVANEKGKNWLEFIPKNRPEEVKEPVDEVKEMKLVYTCSKDGIYAINLKVGEKLYIQ